MPATDRSDLAGHLGKQWRSRQREWYFHRSAQHQPDEYQLRGIEQSGRDGYTTGQLSGLSIDDTGMMFATYTNGQSKVIGQVVLANFTNSQGLASVGGTAGTNAGLRGGYRNAGVWNAGLLAVWCAGRLERRSDTQLVNLIVAQRNYQANAKTVETESAIATIINLR